MKIGNGLREKGGKHEGHATETKAGQSFKERTVASANTCTHHYLNIVMVGYPILRDS